MYLDDISMYRQFGEISRRVTDTALSRCDRAEFLAERGNGAEDVFDLYGTAYEDVAGFEFVRGGKFFSESFQREFLSYEYRLSK